MSDPIDQHAKYVFSSLVDNLIYPLDFQKHVQENLYAKQFDNEA